MGHTIGTDDGYYLYIEASNPRVPGDVARLSSKTMAATTGQCLEFYYHMHGVDIGELNIYMRKESSPQYLGVPIWTKAAEQGPDWHLGKTSLTSTESFQLVFEAVRGKDYKGDIAIDDITVNEGLCNHPPVERRSRKATVYSSADHRRIQFSLLLKCSSNGVQFGDFCYQIEDVGKNYDDASDDCLQKGGFLVTIKSQDEQNFIKELLNTDVHKWTLFWIGLDDKVSEGTFMYSDGSILTSSSFSAWGVGDPNDALGNRDCVNLDYASQNRVWKDVPCQTLNAYICQSPLNLH